MNGRDKKYKLFKGYNAHQLLGDFLINNKLSEPRPDPQPKPKPKPNPVQVL